MIIQKLIDTTLIVDSVIEGLKRGDMLEGGHRVVAVPNTSEITLHLNHPHNFIPGEKIQIVGNIS